MGRAVAASQEADPVVGGAAQGGTAVLDASDLRTRVTSRLALGSGIVAVAVGWWLTDPRLGIGFWPILIVFSLLLQAVLIRSLVGRHLRAAALVLLIGPTLSLAAALRLAHSPMLPAFTALIVLANCTVAPTWGLAAAVLNTLSLLALLPWDGQLLLAVALLWLTAGVEINGSEVLNTVLSWAWHSQERASGLLQALRERQGVLNRTLAALTEATRRLQRTNRELDIALQHAEEARKAKHRFAATISHELRTPLNIIVGFAEMLSTSPESYGDAAWSPALREDVLTIWRNAEHLLKMIDDVLDLAQIEAARLPVLPEPTDLLALIQDTLATVRTLLQASGLELRLALPSTLPIVDIDRTRIRQVLLNLIGNAVRHTPSGFIEVGAYLGQGELVAFVRDSGEGIPAARLEAIFEEFEQVDVSAKRGQQGVGLGLAISRHFVRLHGGHMWAESAVGQGSVFYFTVPLTHERLRRLPRELHRTGRRPLPDSHEGRLVVALVRDPGSARLLERHLGDISVLVASSSAQVEQLVRDEHPEAVLIMGDVDQEIDAVLSEGRQVIELLRPWDVPVIACEAPLERLTSVAPAADGLLLKPVTAGQVTAAISNLCSEPNRLLVVDDQPDMLRFLVQAVSGAWPECEIRAFQTGEEAAAAASWGPDVALLDLILAGMSGSEVLAALRSSPACSHTRVLVITARGQGAEALAGRDQQLSLLKCGGFSSAQLTRLIGAMARTLPASYVQAPASGSGIPEEGQV